MFLLHQDSFASVQTQSHTHLQIVFSDMLDKAWARFTFNIWALQNPHSPNERLRKGSRFADIKASTHATHKTHACISLKQRGYSRNYGLVCNLGKQMAVLSVLRDRASDVIRKHPMGYQICLTI